MYNEKLTGRGGAMNVYVAKYNGQLGFEEKLIWQYCIMENISCCSYDPVALTNGQAIITNPSLVVGSVEALSYFFSKNSITIPTPIDYPSTLSHLLKREIKKIAISKLTNQQFPLFIKPVKCKLFTGKVFETLEEFTHNVKIDTYETVYISVPVKWTSEWRYYIHHGNIIASSNYSGDESLKPDIDIVIEAVNQLEKNGFPTSNYAIDFGVLVCGNTALVEVNDAWALGAYSDITYREYFQILSSRWNEIVGRI